MGTYTRTLEQQGTSQSIRDTTKNIYIDMDVYEESVDRRLSLYSLNKVFPTYVAQLQQVHSLVHRLLTQNLNENDKLAVEYINELKDSLNLKYLEVKNSIDTDRSSYNALDISVERTLDTIKYKLEKYLPEVRS